MRNALPVSALLCSTARFPPGLLFQRLQNSQQRSKGGPGGVLTTAFEGLERCLDQLSDLREATFGQRDGPVARASGPPPLCAWAILLFGVCFHGTSLSFHAACFVLQPAAGFRFRYRKVWGFKSLLVH